MNMLEFLHEKVFYYQQYLLVGTHLGYFATQSSSSQTLLVLNEFAIE